VTDLAVADASPTASTVRLAAAGDQAAFARLVSEHHASMARVAYAIVGSTDAAAEATQSAWSIAWRRLGSLRDEASVRAWLVAIAANEARQALRRRGGRVLVDISREMAVRADSDPGDRIEAIDLARSLRQLKPDERALLALRFVAGLDSTEIAAQLGLSPSGVRTRLARLLERLRKELDRG
jgi:RNA polymerase sigma-70 factor (ECF subfamily)